MLQIFLIARNTELPYALAMMSSVRERRTLMRKFLFAAAAAATITAAVPASAQVYFGADPGGAGVEVGPFGFGVGPRYGYRDHWRGAYAYDRPGGRGRLVPPGGRVSV